MELLIILIVALGLIAPSFLHKTSNDNFGLTSRLYYSIIIVFLLASPIVSLLISNWVGLPQAANSLICFVWVTFAPSLPVSLLVARIGDRKRFSAYVTYLERSSRLSIKSLSIVWVVISLILIVLSGLILKV